MVSERYIRYMALIGEFPLVRIQDSATEKKARTIAERLERQNVQSRLSVDEFEYLAVLKDLINACDPQPKVRFFETDPRQALLRLMKEHSVSQSQLIEIAQDYKSNVSAFLSGKRNISRSVAERLAEYFNVSPDLFVPKMAMSTRARIYCDGGIFGGLFATKLVVDKLNPKLKSGSYELEPYSYKRPFPPYFPVYIWLPKQNPDEADRLDELREEIKRTYAELTEYAYAYRPNSLEERQEECAKLIERIDQLKMARPLPTECETTSSHPCL